MGLFLVSGHASMPILLLTVLAVELMVVLSVSATSVLLWFSFLNTILPLDGALCYLRLLVKEAGCCLSLGGTLELMDVVRKWFGLMGSNRGFLPSVVSVG